MDFITTVDEERRRISIKSQCELDMTIFGDIRSKIAGSLQNRESWDVLIDHSESSLVKLHFPEMKSAADQTSSEFQPLHIRRIAVVVDMADFGMGRMWEIMLSQKGTAMTRVFKTLGEAESFLDG